MTRYFPVLAAALLLAACGQSDQDRLSGSAADEGTAEVSDAALNGMIDADQEVAEVPQPPTATAPAEVPLADIVDPLAPAPASGPSFDCSGAWRDVERLVCDDAELAALDRAMAAGYFRALKAADPARAALLQQSGAAFIRNRNRCPDANCIAQAYDDRVAEIADIMDGAR